MGHHPLILAFLLILPLTCAVYDVSYDLTSSVGSVVGSSRISAVVADPVHHIVYFGTEDAKLGYYNETSNTSVDLTSLISGWAAGEVWGMTLDTTQGRLWFTAGQIMNVLGYYELSTNTTYHSVFDFVYFTRLAYDSDRNVIWYDSNDGTFGFIDAINLSYTNTGATTGWAAATCLMDENERLFMGFIAGSQNPIYYNIGNGTTKDLTGILPLNIWSCDKDDENGLLWFGCGETYLASGYYNWMDDSTHTVFTCADGPVAVATKYMRNSNTVAFLESGGELGGRIYSLANDSIEWIQNTDPDGWMDAYQMASGDYALSSKRLYIGFTGGGFGYYDNDVTLSTKYQQVGLDLTNNTGVNLSGLYTVGVVRAYFVSWNLSTNYITLYFNGTPITTGEANNYTWVDFNLANVTLPGFYLVHATTPENSTGIYHFTVLNVSGTSPPIYDQDAAAGLYPGLAGFLALDIILILCGMYLAATIKANWDIISIRRTGDQNALMLRLDMAMKFVGIMVLCVMGLVISGYSWFASVRINSVLGKLAFVFFLLNIMVLVLCVLIAGMKLVTIPVAEVKALVDKMAKTGNYRR